MGRALARAIPGARFTEIAGAGHFVAVERFGEIVAALIGSRRLRDR